MARQISELAGGSKATARFVWISPSKVREVCRLIIGKQIDEARRILAFTPRSASRLVAKVLESAIANAEHNHQIPQEELFVRVATADEGPTAKRVSPRARRAAYLIRRRMSHITVAVERIPVEELPERPPPRAGRGRARKPERQPATREPAKESEEQPARSGRRRATGAKKPTAKGGKRGS